MRNSTRTLEIRQASRMLHETLEEAREKTFRQSRESYGSLWEAYEIACGLLVELSEILSRDPGEIDISDEQSNRVSLTANMVQSSMSVEYLISSGQYVLAAGILRHHLETLARIVELRTGSEKAQKARHKPANVKILPFRLSRDFGRLSEIVHTTKGEFLGSFAEIPGKPGIASLFSSYRQEWSEGLFCMFTAIMTVLVGEVFYLAKELHTASSIPGFVNCIERIMQILLDIGYFKRL